MFDIGFTELLLLAVVALVVLGPERLPKAARFAGLWVRRARAQWYSVKSELERELAAEELKRSLHDVEGMARDVGRQVEDEARAAEAGVRAAERQAREEVEAMRRRVDRGAASTADPTALAVEATDVDKVDDPAALIADAGDTAATQQDPPSEAAALPEAEPRQPDLLAPDGRDIQDGAGGGDGPRR
ncbi:Sec-independent protein translocase protein TatB [Luteimonas aestuarii]|uniref:Sec-independent protein translocase protein TatB n=1 Tax=Luteimonas aestuarii TaxID=453837 RepID=UPI001FB75348|nr:Sec-independent protein translocase protein TatB [Luteimonas aestuarii]